MDIEWIITFIVGYVMHNIFYINLIISLFYHINSNSPSCPSYFQIYFIYNHTYNTKE